MLTQISVALQTFLGFGASIMIPVIIFIFALLIGIPIGKAFKSALTIGIGFTGVFLVVNLLVDNMAPAAQAMVSETGIKLDLIDVGWPSMAAMTWAWIGAVLVFPIGIVINAVMLWRGWTKTLNVDLWNYWQFAFIGAAVYFLTGNNLVLGLIAAGLASIVALIFADYTQHWCEKYFDLPGISFPHLTAVGWLPLFMPIIAGLNSFKWWRKLPVVTPESVQKRFGIMGLPIVWGLILGILLGVAAKQSLQGVLSLGLTMASVMLLLPRMVSVLMEGLIPISESARAFLRKRTSKEAQLYIGMDAALAIGHPSVIATGLLLVPIFILLAFTLPGVRVLPFVDLAVFPFLICLTVAMNKGDVLRSTITGTLMSIGVLYGSMILSPLQTALAVSSNIALPDIAAGSLGITNLDRSQFITVVLTKVFGFFSPNGNMVENLVYLALFIFLILSLFVISPRLAKNMIAREEQDEAEEGIAENAAA
ncbi:MAG: PTS transporter subunit IIC [Anaerolineaceae bacterium]|jgi:PTS system galactitol-specific IIC component|nr:PTS transporter subunit IIC [Anaerolineaceae bacterium]